MFRPNLRPVVCDSVSMLRKHRESLSVCSVGPRAPLRANVINLPNDIVDSCSPLSLDFPHGGHLPPQPYPAHPYLAKAKAGARHAAAMLAYRAFFKTRTTKLSPSILQLDLARLTPKVC